MYFPDRGCVRPLRHLYGYATDASSYFWRPDSQVLVIVTHMLIVSLLANDVVR